MASVFMWARLVFMLPTHRIVKLAPGLYVQVKRGTSNRELGDTLAGYLKGRKR